MSLNLRERDLVGSSRGRSYAVSTMFGATLDMFVKDGERLIARDYVVNGD